MCGLAGIVDLNGLDRNAVAAPLARAVANLHPRGPDDHSVWLDGKCALGHTRLSIIDLSSAGAQPMVRGSLTLIYNGLIYNFPELRDELSAAGYVFEGRSDTEVLLTAWRHWGESALDRLNGMFAFALWDADSDVLYLARDRFGKKPIAYRTNGNRISFASDLATLSRLDETNGEIDEEALSLYFALRFVPDPWSILKGVSKLPPGHLLRFDQRGAHLSRWAKTERNIAPKDEDDAAERLRSAIDDAVAARMVADVPVGAFLSGGIDSATVAASMVASSGEVRTFTVGFADAADYYEERPTARRTADYLGTDHTEIELDAADGIAALNEVIGAFDEPFADSSAIPTFLIARETRRHVTVALSGDGGDEVFGGYRKYQGELAAPAYRRIPGWIRRGLVEPLCDRLPENKDTRLGEQARRLRRFVGEAGKDAAARQAGWLRLLSASDLSRLLIRDVAGPTPEELISRLRGASPESDPINAMLAADIAFGLPGDMLVKVDRASMANSLEVRCPLLDRRVVACAAGMPGAYKLRWGDGKHILRRAMQGRLPDEILRGQKKGFEVPIADWLRGPLRELASRAVDPARLERQGLLRSDLPIQWQKDLESGRRDTSWQLWTVIAFQGWWDRHMNGARAT